MLHQLSLDSLRRGAPSFNSSRDIKMKKLLIASTALVATAGMAAAEGHH